MTDDPASRLAALRRHDPDRYLTTLFAPAAMRDTLVILYEFNHELARAAEVASEPGLVLIRLQWWREVVEGEDRPHEVATPLRDAIQAGRLPTAPLLAMIEARERELESFATLSDWRDWLLLGAGSLALAAGQALGAPQTAQPRLRHLGAGYGVTGQCRSMAHFARQNRCLLPQDVLETHGLTSEAVIANPNTAELSGVRTELNAVARTLLGQPEHCGTWVAACLPAILARRDLTRTGPRGLADRLAVTAAALQKRA